METPKIEVKIGRGLAVFILLMTLTLGLYIGHVMENKPARRTVERVTTIYSNQLVPQLVLLTNKLLTMERNNNENIYAINQYRSKIDDLHLQLAIAKLVTNNIITNTVVITNVQNNIIRDTQQEEKLQSQIDELNKQIQIAVIELDQKNTDNEQLKKKVEALIKERNTLQAELNDIAKLKLRIRKLEYENWKKRKTLFRTDSNKGVDGLNELNERKLMQKMENTFDK